MLDHNNSRALTADRTNSHEEEEQQDMKSRDRIRNVLHGLFAAGTLLTLVAGMALPMGCENEGEFEDAAEDVGEGVEDTAEDVGEATEDAVDEIDDG
jgi:hypothetical protein